MAISEPSKICSHLVVFKSASDWLIEKSLKFCLGGHVWWPGTAIRIFVFEWVFLLLFFITFNSFYFFFHKIKIEKRFFFLFNSIHKIYLCLKRFSFFIANKIFSFLWRHINNFIFFMGTKQITFFSTKNKSCGLCGLKLP